MSRERWHGSRACYVFGPEPGGDRARGCRCDPCKEANRLYARTRDRDSRRPDVDVNPAYIDAAEVRSHLRWLQCQGVGRRAVHAASGVALSSIARLRSGQRERCRPETAERLMLVFPVDAAGGAVVDAAPTWRLLDDLLAHGYTRTDLARRLGSTSPTPSLQIGRSAVLASTARKVKDLHAELMASEIDDRRFNLPRPEGRMMSERWHGTAGGYTNHACRCDDCRRAHRDAMRGYRTPARSVGGIVPAKEVTPAPGKGRGSGRTSPRRVDN